MLHITSIQELATNGITDAVIAAGTFDGLHIGHQAVLTELVKMAERYHAVPVALTFSPHPRAVLDPGHAPELLISEDQRIEAFASFGCKAAVVIPFTRELAQLTPEAFLDTVFACPSVRIHALCVGSDWHFGAKAAGDGALLANRAARDGFAFCPVKEILWNGKPISSTVIRGLIQDGNVLQANELLGRFPAVGGPIVHGNRVASTELRCATANVQVTDGMMPKDGVYAAWAQRSGEPEHVYRAVVNIGFAPTFQVGERRVEAHLLDCTASSFYDETLTLEFVDRLRDERRFPDVPSLMAQIGNDIEQTKHILKERKDTKWTTINNFSL